MNETRQRSSDKHACHKTMRHSYGNSASYSVTLFSSADVGFSVLILYVDSQPWMATEKIPTQTPLHMLWSVVIQHFLKSSKKRMSFFLSVFPANPNYRPLSVLLRVCSPAPSLCAVIESSCRRVTIVQTEQLLEEGPGFIQSSTLNAIKSPRVLSFNVGFRCINTHAGLSLRKTHVTPRPQ